MVKGENKTFFFWVYVSVDFKTGGKTEPKHHGQEQKAKSTRRVTQATWLSSLKREAACQCWRAALDYDPSVFWCYTEPSKQCVPLTSVCNVKHPNSVLNGFDQKSFSCTGRHYGANEAVGVATAKWCNGISFWKYPRRGCPWSYLSPV